MDLLPVVPGDDEGERLGLVHHIYQDFPVETKDGSWLGQSLDRFSGLQGQVLADEAVICTGVHEEWHRDKKTGTTARLTRILRQGWARGTPVLQ